MTADDRMAFAEVLVSLAEVFGEKDVSTMRTALYFEALRDLTVEEVRAAAGRWMRSGRFFPKPAELIEAIEGTTEDQGELAWARFLGAVREFGAYDSVDFADPVLHAVVIDLWGGWPEACRLDERETPFRHQDFARLYRVRAKQRGDLRSGHLPGLSEGDNRRKGLDAFVPAPRRVPGAPVTERRSLEVPPVEARALPEPERPTPRRRHLRSVPAGEQLDLAGDPERTA